MYHACLTGPTTGCSRWCKFQAKSWISQNDSPIPQYMKIPSFRTQSQTPWTTLHIDTNHGHVQAKPEKANGGQSLGLMVTEPGRNLHPHWAEITFLCSLSIILLRELWLRYRAWAFFSHPQKRGTLLTFPETGTVDGGGRRPGTKAWGGDRRTGQDAAGIHSPLHAALCPAVYPGPPGQWLHCAGAEQRMGATWEAAPLWPDPLQLGTLPFLPAVVGMGSNFYYFLHLVDYCSGPARQFFGLLGDFLNSVTSWFASWLSLLFCMKTANFTRPSFLWLKWRFPALVPWLLLGSLLTSFIVTLLFFGGNCTLYKGSFTRKPFGNMTCISGAGFWKCIISCPWNWSLFQFLALFFWSRLLCWLTLWGDAHGGCSTVLTACRIPAARLTPELWSH